MNNVRYIDDDARESELPIWGIEISADDADEQFITIYLKECWREWIVASVDAFYEDPVCMNVEIRGASEALDGRPLGARSTGLLDQGGGSQ